MSEPIVIGDSGRRKNTRVKILAGVALGILVLSQVPKLLGGGGDATSDQFTSVPDQSSATTLPLGDDAPRETFETFSSKNPFTPLVVLGVATDPEPVATTDTIPLEPFPVDPGFVEPEPIVDDGTTGSTVPAAAQPPPRVPDRVGLLEVYTDLASKPVASVRVNDTTYQVARGDVFATSYRVVSLDTRDRCAELLFGDDKFTLCEGDEVRK